MSAKILNYVPWPAENGIIAQCCCDTVAELPAVNAFSSYGLLATTSTCLVIDTDEVYQLNSLGVWKKKTQSTSVALDLTGYYTQAEVDALIAEASIGALVRGESIPANADLDNYVTAGRFYCTSGNSASVQHKPYNASVSFELTVEQNQGSARPLQTITYNTNSASYIGKFCKRWFDPVALSYGGWFVFEGVAL